MPRPAPRCAVGPEARPALVGAADPAPRMPQFPPRAPANLPPRRSPVVSHACYGPTPQDRNRSRERSLVPRLRTPATHPTAPPITGALAMSTCWTGACPGVQILAPIDPTASGVPERSVEAAHLLAGAAASADPSRPPRPYCFFVAGVLAGAADFVAGAADLVAGAAGAGVTTTAALMLSSLGKLLSRYALPWLMIRSCWGASP